MTEPKTMALVRIAVSQDVFTIGEAVEHNLWLRLTCQKCGHESWVEPSGALKGKEQLSIAQLRGRSKCTGCATKSPEVVFARQRNYPMPKAEPWTAAYNSGSSRDIDADNIGSQFEVIIDDGVSSGFRIEEVNDLPTESDDWGPEHFEDPSNHLWPKK